MLRQFSSLTSFSFASKHWSEWLWDAWCVISLIGLWPRFIEPRLLKVKRLRLVLSDFPELHGIKLLHFSDLHWSRQLPGRFLKKIIARINQEKADLIFFTGDFLSRSQLEHSAGLREFLQSLTANIGCFAVLGNHDYAEFVSVNERGDYDIEKPSPESNIIKGMKRLFYRAPLTKKVTSKAAATKQHEELEKLIETTPFQLLNNTTRQVAYNGRWINICGLEEYSLGKCHPAKAFKNYQPEHPGIILTHNPDSIAMLKTWPGNLILSGHTHGGQINLPWLWKRFTQLEHPEFKRGLKRIGEKWAYINRGLSSVMKFRWFSTPELTSITIIA